MAAAELLASDWGIAAEVWSATSFSELAREARDVERFNRLQPAEPARTSHVRRCLAGDAPVIASTDYVRAWPQLIASYIDAPFTALGTDGFGRSGTRAQPCAVSSRSTAITWYWPHSRRCANRARSTRRLAPRRSRYGLAPDVLAPWLV
jgi:pyruvate dehydrogenase E1 component